MILQLHCFCAVLEQNIMVGGYRGTDLFISWSIETRDGKGPRMYAFLENRSLVTQFLQLICLPLVPLPNNTKVLCIFKGIIHQLSQRPYDPFTFELMESAKL